MQSAHRVATVERSSAPASQTTPQLVVYADPLALHGGVTVILALAFTLLARIIAFGRIAFSPTLIALLVGVAALFLAMIGLFIANLWAALCATHGLTVQHGRRTILLVSLAAGLCMVALPRLFSTDVLSYISYGRALSVYGLNPYLNNPINMQFDYTFRVIEWHDTVTVYGPAWTLLSVTLNKLIGLFAGNTLWGYIIGYRLLGLACHVGNAALLWTILGRMRPRDQVAGTIFYAWSPLPLIEFPGNGHNDAVLLLCLLAAIAAHTATPRRQGVVMLCLILSVLTKFITLLVIPSYLVLLWRGRSDHRSWAWTMGKVGAVGVSACVLLWLPFATAIRNPAFLLDSAANTQYYNSFLELIYWGVRALLATVLPVEQSAAVAGLVVKAAGRALFIGLAIACTWRVRDTQSWLVASFWLLCGYLLLAAPWFWPWYAIWPLTLAPLAGGRRATALALSLSASVLLVYIFWGNRLPFDRTSQYATIYPLRNALAFGFPLLIAWRQLRAPGVPTEPVYARPLPPGWSSYRAAGLKAVIKEAP